MSFSFDFLGGNGETATEIRKASSCSSRPENDQSLQRRHSFRWISNLQDLFVDRQKDEIVYDEQQLDEDLVRCVDHEKSMFVEAAREKDDNDPKKDQQEAWQRQDLVPGEYEGGMKVWECSQDLVKWMDKELIHVPSKILELGCGFALPGCYLLRKGLRQQIENLEVVFTDYNDYVLKDVTLSNVVINTFEWKNAISHVKMGSGDWLDFAQNYASEQFDLIVAAETLYSPQAARDTALILEILLSEEGVAYIATKRYYFGVGGGSEEFVKAAEKNLKVETCHEIDQGNANIREILKVTRL